MSNLYSVEPCYNEDIGTMKITLLYKVSHIMVLTKNRHEELGPVIVVGTLTSKTTLLQEAFVKSVIFVTRWTVPLHILYAYYKIKKYQNYFTSLSLYSFKQKYKIWSSVCKTEVWFSVGTMCNTHTCFCLIVSCFLSVCNIHTCFVSCFLSVCNIHTCFVLLFLVFCPCVIFTHVFVLLFMFISAYKSTIHLSLLLNVIVFLWSKMYTPNTEIIYWDLLNTAYYMLICVMFMPSNTIPCIILLSLDTLL